MNKKLRTTGLILTIIVMIFLAACQSGTNETKETVMDSAPSTTKPDSTSTTPASVEDKSPQTITWFADQEWYKKQWDPQNNELDKMITHDTGISVDMTSGNGDKLSAMIASNDLPDVITVTANSPQRGILEKSGMMAPLDEWIPKYAPAYNIPKSMQDWYRNANGHVYGVANFFSAPELMKPENYYETFATSFARQDLMDQLGIKTDDFKTKQGTIEALRKVKKASLKYKGFAVTPAYFDFLTLLQYFGAPREDKQGNYVDRERTPEALEVFKFLNQLYREGLLPEDSQTLDNTQIQQKVNSGGVFAFSSWLIDSGALFNSDPKALFVPIGPIASDKGNAPSFEPPGVSGWTLTMINKNAKHPERILQFFQYMSQEEMSVNAWYGPKGVAWNYDESKHIKFTEQRTEDYKKDANAADQKYGSQSFSWFVNWYPIQSAYPAPTTAYEKARVEASTGASKHAYNALPFEATTPPGGSEEAITAVKINDYRSKMRAKMILASSEEKTIQIFNEMADQENKLGYPKLYDFQNKAFKEAKQRLGIPFAWPANK